MSDATESYYRAALTALRFVEARRPTGRRFGAEADALWASFAGGLLAEAGRRAPWQLTHGEIRFEFNAEAVLAAHWQVELRLLLGYIIAVRTTPQSRAGGGMVS